ncbi:MAG: hypothetical protein COU51_03575 [Parcubacteria group bacterium CG10_big_fil_rev_8_21_14_0_10_36_14]|nr:MAG: hypothetical protein COU51_03575 [Parcubacteria group bacterium CG10_big_fil_rev_8_21_14_0_10_36_14]
MSSFKEVSISAEIIFKEFCGYIHSVKDQEYIALLLARIYSSETSAIVPEVSIYWVLPFRWMFFGKKIGLPKEDFLKLIYSPNL